MAQLVQMRQRMKAIETIKKITHAMRLISMSARAQLKGREKQLKTYTNTTTSLFFRVKSQAPQWRNAIMYPDITAPERLVILVGSKKGLCGNFNSALFKLFEKEEVPVPRTTHYIAIGKKAADYMGEKKDRELITTYENFSVKTLITIAKDVTQKIVRSAKPYGNVIFFSNQLKTFFLQKPQKSLLIPFAHTDKPADFKNIETEYHWEQEPDAILDILAHQCVEATILSTLFQSLLAEQAARFLSMDGSTRNAKNLLEETQLLYNKLRQAKITKELTELTDSF